jgi:hypothetical protein
VVVLRCFYGDDEISREEADHKHSEHIQHLEDGIQDYLDHEEEALIVFDDEGKYRHVGNPTADQEQLAPCILHAMANFTSALNRHDSDYCADHLEERVFLIEDKKGCLGEGFLLVGFTHRGLFHQAGRMTTEEGLFNDFLIERTECNWSLLTLKLF